jgi:hypothetical protein
MSEKALFISRTSALMGVIREGRKAGVKDEVIQKHGHAHPVYRRGELIGWNGYVPVNNTADWRKAIVEN